MRKEWSEWFVNQIDNGRLLNYEQRESPDRKYWYTNFGLNEVPFHMEFISWLSKYVDRDDFDMECYHVHVWGPGCYFDEHTDNYSSRMFTYVNEMESSLCDGGLYVDGKFMTEGYFATKTPHLVKRITKGRRISLTVFGYKSTSLL